MKSAIIGTGWLGHPLALQLAAAGHEVYGSRRSEFPEQPFPYHSFQYPSDDAETAAILQTVDAIVLAFPPRRTTIDQYADDCLEVCSLLNDRCTVILTSSTSTYESENGRCREADIDETRASEHPIVRAEQALRKRLGDRLTIVRLAGLIGPDRYPVRNMSKSGKTYEGGEPVNVIHQADAVNLIAYIIEHAITGTIINGCAAEHPQRGAFYTRMAEQLGIAPPAFVYESTQGKIISSERSRELGFSYVYDDPFGCILE